MCKHGTGRGLRARLTWQDGQRTTKYSAALTSCKTWKEDPQSQIHEGMPSPFSRRGLLVPGFAGGWIELTLRETGLQLDGRRQPHYRREGETVLNCERGVTFCVRCWNSPSKKTMKLNEKSMVHFATSDSPADCTGYLNKRGEQNTAYKRRWFVLKGNLLFYFEDRESKEPVGVVVLEGCTVELCQSSEEYAFAIKFNVAGSRSYILAADSQEEMESWVKALSRASFDYMRLVVKELEMQLERMQRSSARKKFNRSRGRSRTVGRTKLDNSASSCSYNGFLLPEIYDMTSHSTQNNPKCQYNKVIPPPLPPRRRGAQWVDSFAPTSSIKSLESPVCPGTACFSKLHDWYGREIQDIRRIWQNEQKEQND